jgi:hypothetical protein
MPFRRFFGKNEQPAQPEQGAEEETDDVVGIPEGDDISPELVDAVNWRLRAEGVLPSGASTGSKRAEALYGRSDADAPTHFTRAAGCRVWDTDGFEYIDCGMALGAVALGYAEPDVSHAVADAIAAGHVSLLSPAREVEVANWGPSAPMGRRRIQRPKPTPQPMARSEPRTPAKAQLPAPKGASLVLRTQRGAAASPAWRN